MSETRHVDQEALAFFNDLSGTLDIVLTKPAEPVSPGLMNRSASPDASIRSVSLEMTRYEGDDFHALTEEEQQRVVIRAPRIAMRSGRAKEAIVEHEAPSGGAYTVRDLTVCVEETERKGRGASAS